MRLFKVDIKSLFSGFPGWLLTSAKTGVARLQVDSGSTGFFDGREFRAFMVLNIPAGETRLVRVNVGVGGLIIRKEMLTVDGGKVDYLSWRGAVLSGTGSWADINATQNCGIFNQNNLPDVQPWTRQTQVEVGTSNTTVTSGITSDFTGIVASTATAQQNTEGLTDSDERGVGQGEYILSYTNIGNSDVRVIHKLKLEERLLE